MTAASELFMFFFLMGEEERKGETSKGEEEEEDMERQEMRKGLCSIYNSRPLWFGTMDASYPSQFTGLQ